MSISAEQSRRSDREAGRRSRGAKAGLVAVACVFVFLATVGATYTFTEIGRLRDELSSTRWELLSAKDRLARLERKVDQPSLAQRLDGNHLRSQLELSREEIQLLRDYIKVPPAPRGATATIQLGAMVPPVTLAPLPPQVGAKFSRLIGARFTTDRNGAIVIVARGSRSADAIVAPN